MMNVSFPNSAPLADAGPGERPTPARLALIQSLEELRELVNGQLNALENEIRERAHQSSKSLDGREEQLQQRAIDLEHAHVHITTESDRWESERQEMVEQIEHDRRLLAEAWERIERAQVGNVGAAPMAARPNTVAAPLAAPAATPAPWPVTRSSPGCDRPVAEEVLRQFQSLRRDVRRNAAKSYAV